MKILAIETSNRRTSVAVVAGDQVLVAEQFFSPRRETGPLFSTVQRALAAAGLPDRIVVGTGPGSYSGIRAGIALAQGLGLAADRPVFGLSSLLGLPLGRWLVFGDARSAQVFHAVLEDGKLIELPQLDASDEVPRLCDAWSGFSPVRVGELAGMAAQFPCLWPAAERLAAVAQVDSAALHPPAPIYLKPAHITRPGSGSGALQPAARRTH